MHSVSESAVVHNETKIVKVDPAFPTGAPVPVPSRVIKNCDTCDWWRPAADDTKPACRDPQICVAGEDWKARGARTCGNCGWQNLGGTELPYGNCLEPQWLKNKGLKPTCDRHSMWKPMTDLVTPTFTRECENCAHLKRKYGLRKAGCRLAGVSCKGHNQWMAKNHKELLGLIKKAKPVKVRAKALGDQVEDMLTGSKARVKVKTDKHVHDASGTGKCGLTCAYYKRAYGPYKSACRRGYIDHGGMGEPAMCTGWKEANSPVVKVKTNYGQLCETCKYGRGDDCSEPEYVKTGQETCKLGSRYTRRYVRHTCYNCKFGVRPYGTRKYVKCSKPSGEYCGGKLLWKPKVK